ncbi:LysR family transcriptional regulator [Uliginosibacterium paludis]|uniref:LysR family transcriptional regulator n=1 Tax=Uliginosibacterium paludis TaxID=1615952 RepID=A0ABV2CME2_9RHOO
MHFDLTDLRLLLAIAETGSLSRAAAAFPIALSAASNRLRAFEARCGVMLFSRSASGMVLTPQGRLVIDRVRQVVNESLRLKETMQDLAGHRRIVLRLAGTTVANSSFLPAALGPFLADHPEIDLQLTERNSAEVVQALHAGDIEIGVYDGSLPAADLVSLPFRDDRLVLLVPGGHPLASRRETLFADALAYPFVCLPPERSMQRFIESGAERLGRALQIRVRAPGFDAIAQLVAQKAGVAMLPEAAALRLVRELPVEIVTLADAWASRELRLCIRDWETLSPHAHSLLSYLCGDLPR